MSRQIVMLIMAMTVTLAISLATAHADHAWDMPDRATVRIPDGITGPGCGDECFMPRVATISVGGTVTWWNTDLAFAHTVASGVLADGGPDGVFYSGLLSPFGSFSHTFGEAGEYPYFCMVHPWMNGLVMVHGATQPTAHHMPVTADNITEHETTIEFINLVRAILMETPTGDRFMAWVTISGSILNELLYLIFPEARSWPECLYNMTHGVVPAHGDRFSRHSIHPCKSVAGVRCHSYLASCRA